MLCEDMSNTDIGTRKIDGTEASSGIRSVARVVAALAVVSVLVAGTALVAGAQSSGGVSCSAGTASITVSWTGQANAVSYYVSVTDSSGDTTSSRDVDAETLSATFTGLAPGSYTVTVTSNEGPPAGSIPHSRSRTLGSASCTVTATSTTTSTTTTTPTNPVGGL